MKIQQRSWTLLSTHSALSVPAGKKPWWKRALQGCVTSSNPDNEEEGGATSTLVSVGKKPRRAAYIPKYAKSSFAKSTTPIKYKDPDRVKDITGIYRSASTMEHVQGGGLRNRGKYTKTKKQKKVSQASSRPLTKVLLGKG